MPSFFPPTTTTTSLASSSSTTTRGTLPPFRTLLVQGPYHPSAPIHLAYSALTSPSNATPQTPDRPSGVDSDSMVAEATSTNLNSSPAPRPVVLLSPSKKQFGETLAAFNDDWIITQTGRVDVLKTLHDAVVLYPPSAAHLCYALSMFRVCPPVVPETDAGKAWLKPKTTFVEVPSLIILLELSKYFLKEEEGGVDANEDQQWTLSSYLAVVATAQSTLSRLLDQDLAKSIRLVIFDSKLLDLKLPILKLPTSHQTTSAGDTAGSSANPQRGEPVAPLVKKYIECVCEFWEGSESESTRIEIGLDVNVDDLGHGQLPVQSRKRGCTFMKTAVQKPGDKDESVRWTWVETKTAGKGVVFTWAE